MKHLIYLRGTLALQLGLNPRIIENILLSLLPEEYRNECKDFMKEQEEKKQLLIKKMLSP